MKRVVIIALLLSFIPNTARADLPVCPNNGSTLFVTGIGTYGGVDLACKDAGGLLNVVVRGLETYRGFTQYCWWHGIRKNYGSEAAPNWSYSTDNGCDQAWPIPVVVPTPTPTPTLIATPIKIDTTTIQVQAPTVVQTAPVVNSTIVVTPITDTSTVTVVIPIIVDTPTAVLRATPQVVVKKVIKKKGKK